MTKILASVFQNHKKKLFPRFERTLLVTCRTVGLILIYYFFSIGITFYQKWFIKRFHFPLVVVVCHMFFKFLLASLFRNLYRHYSGITRISLSWKESIRKMSLPGIASALDIGFSNWSFEFITISLYTMTKSTCIIFILGFAILFDLEKKRLSLMVVVTFISVGLIMFTYKSTQFQLNGFLLVLCASMLSGLRWTLSQKLMQRKESSLSNPMDMMYHIQPWMIIGLLPLTLFFEIIPTIHNYTAINSLAVTSSQEVNTMEVFHFWQIVHLILIGSILAFLMEFSEFLLLTYTSSLTLSMAGIFKEVFTLYLAINFNGDQMSRLNFMGLVICLAGIVAHVFFKVIDASNNTDILTIGSRTINKSDENESKQRLLDEEIVHFEMSPTKLQASQAFGAKSI